MVGWGGAGAGAGVRAGAGGDGCLFEDGRFLAEDGAALELAARDGNASQKRKCTSIKTLWPSGLRRWLKAPVRKGVGSNPTGVNFVHAQ